MHLRVGTPEPGYDCFISRRAKLSGSHDKRDKAPLRAGRRFQLVPFPKRDTQITGHNNNNTSAGEETGFHCALKDHMEPIAVKGT